MTNPTTNISEDFKIGYREGKKQREAEILEIIKEVCKGEKTSIDMLRKELKSKIKGEKGK